MMRTVVCSAVLLAMGCKGNARDANMPPGHVEDAQDGVVGGRTVTSEVVGTYSIFQPLGCVDDAGGYLPPPSGRLKLVSVAPPASSSEPPRTVVHPGLAGYPSEIENAYSEDGERMWFSYRPEGPGYQLVLPLDWSKEEGRTELVLHPPGSYTFEITGNQYRVRGTEPTRCPLAVLWVGTNFHPGFTPPSETELGDRTSEYEAALTSRAPGADAKAHRQAWHDAFHGVNVYHIGEYENAVTLLDRSFQKLRTPHLALWSARALAEAGRIDEAKARYAQAASLALTVGDEGVERRAQQTAATELGALEAPDR